MRKRLNLSLTSDLHAGLTRIATRYGFNSTCELAVTLLKVFLARAQGAEVEDAEAGLCEEIDEMFGELMDYEPTPSNTLVPKRHRRTDK